MKVYPRGEARFPSHKYRARSAQKGRDAMEEIRYTIQGEARTKKNSLMIAGNGARCPVCKKPAKQWVRQGKVHDEYAKGALWQLMPRPAQPIDYKVNVQCLFYMKTRRRVDLLNLLATVDDLLVEAGILADDNTSVVVSHDGSRCRYDKENPRTEIIITRAKEEEP